MAQKKYKKQQINPLKNEWEDMGVALLLEVDAETLNSNSEVTKTRYVLEGKKRTVKK